MDKINKTETTEVCSVMEREPISKNRIISRRTSGERYILLAILLIALFFNSCAFFKVSMYTVGLAKVETPANAKIQYGETKIVNIEEEGKSKYRYEDDFIEISWFVGSKQFYFDLKNKSNYSIKIPWDEVSYVNEKGTVMRLMHSGVKYIDRNASQPASIVPKNAAISDILLPTDHIYYVSGEYGGWREKNLFPQYKTQEEAQYSAIIGKTVRIVFPLIIENITNEYIFEFVINDVSVK